MSFAILDALIGLLLVYVVLSLICAGVVEAFSNVVGQRGRLLAVALERMLGKDLAAQFNQDHRIRSLSRRDGSRPAYIASDTFAAVTIDLLGTVSPTSAAAEPPGIATDARAVVARAIGAAAGDLATARASLVTWFDEVMARATGWYQHWSRGMLVVCALIVAALTNADTIAIVERLLGDPALRESLLALAQRAAENDQLEETADAIRLRLDSIAPLLGWDAGFELSFTKVIGLGLTAGASSLGAPFWFDLLRRMVALRGSQPVVGEPAAPVPPSEPKDHPQPTT